MTRKIDCRHILPGISDAGFRLDEAEQIVYNTRAVEKIYWKG